MFGPKFLGIVIPVKDTIGLFGLYLGTGCVNERLGMVELHMSLSIPTNRNQGQGQGQGQD